MDREVGTEIFMISACATCYFEGQEEMDVNLVLTDQDVQETKDWLRQRYHETGCEVHIGFGIYLKPPYRRGISQALPPSAQALLIR